MNFRNFTISAIVVFSLLIVASQAAVNDTINGLVIDSLTNAPIDSTDVGSEGILTKTKHDGTFQLIIPTTETLPGRQMLQSPGITWNPQTSAFSWPEISREPAIRILDVQGRVAARHYPGENHGDCRFSIAGLPQGIFIAVFAVQGRSTACRIIRIQENAGSPGNAVILPADPGHAAGIATAGSHVLTCSKGGYLAKSVTAAVGTSGVVAIKVKMIVSSFNVPWDWSGVLGTGQSLAVGAQGNPVRSKTQPYHNLKLSTGSLPWPVDPNNTSLAMVPLIEPVGRLSTAYPSSWPTNIAGETAHSAMGNQITALFLAATGRDYINVHGEVGENGQCMIYLKKNAVQSGVNGRAFAASLIETRAITRLSKAAGKTYGIGAVILTHGECDAGSATYENDIHTLWSDCNTDLAAITGQTQKILMIVSQQHSVTLSASTLAQWKVGVDYPADIVCSGPKYQFPYAPDHVHLNAEGYQQLGEKYGQIYFARVVLGQNWQPLQPVAASRSGRAITVRFHVPVPPLVWDTAFQAPHQAVAAWKNGRGFEVRTSVGRVTIDSVAVSGDSVRISCASTIAPGDTVGYAMTTEASPMSTPFAGTVRWGLLRDSDPFVGAITRKALPDYCVAFEMVLP